MLGIKSDNSVRITNINQFFDYLEWFFVYAIIVIIVDLMRSRNEADVKPALKIIVIIGVIIIMIRLVRIAILWSIPA